MLRLEDQIDRRMGNTVRGGRDRYVEKTKASERLRPEVEKADGEVRAYFIWMNNPAILEERYTKMRKHIKEQLMFIRNKSKEGSTERIVAETLLKPGALSRKNILQAGEIWRQRWLEKWLI